MFSVNLTHRFIVLRVSLRIIRDVKAPGRNRVQTSANHVQHIFVRRRLCQVYVFATSVLQRRYRSSRFVATAWAGYYILFSTLSRKQFEQLIVFSAIQMLRFDNASRSSQFLIPAGARAQTNTHNIITLRILLCIKIIIAFTR